MNNNKMSEMLKKINKFGLEVYKDCSDYVIKNKDKMSKNKLATKTVDKQLELSKKKVESMSLEIKDELLTFIIDSSCSSILYNSIKQYGGNDEVH